MTLRDLSADDLRQRAAHMASNGYNRLRIMDDLAHHNARSGIGLDLDALKGMVDETNKAHNPSHPDR